MDALQHRTPPTEPHYFLDARLSAVKVLASAGVVMVHTSMFALGDARQLHSIAWWSANLGNSMGRSASMLFVMVAGAVFLSRPIEEHPWRFVGSRLRRLLPSLISFSAFYFWWRFWQGEPITLVVVLRDTIAGTPYYHLWFLYAMVGIYALMPATRLLAKAPAYRSVAILTLVASMAYVWLFGVGMAFEGRWPIILVAVTPMLVPFLISGYLLYRDGSTLSTRQLSCGAAFCLAAIMMAMAWLYPGATSARAAGMYALRVPLTFGWLFALFLLVLRWPMRESSTKLIQGLAPITLGVYLIHPFWIDVIARFGSNIKQPGGWWLAYAVLVYALSAGTAWALAQVPVIRNLVR